VRAKKASDSGRGTVNPSRNALAISLKKKRGE
jgi:hypothetical protein